MVLNYRADSREATRPVVEKSAKALRVDAKFGLLWICLIKSNTRSER